MGCISLSDHSCGTSLNPKTLQLKMAAITELIRSEQSPSTPTHHTGLEEKTCSFYLTCVAVPQQHSPHMAPQGWGCHTCACTAYYLLFFTSSWKGSTDLCKHPACVHLTLVRKGRNSKKNTLGVLPLTTTTWHAGNSKCCCRPGWVLTGLTGKEERLKEKTNNFLLIIPCWQKARFS